MTREESAEALRLILMAKATPAQIGAFMIAHRIRRPEPQELAGMLDTYLELGPKLTSKDQQKPPFCFGIPFDGRCRTSPIYPLTSLVLLSAGHPVVLQGGKRMPIKYGVTSIELFSSLGISLEGLSIQEVQSGFDTHNFALIHQPDHFPLAETIITYRDQLGKRPPIASMELIWTSHQGDHVIISGFVHPPTEEKARKALKLLGEENLIFIKGLEGSIDLSINRSCITGQIKKGEFHRIILNPHHYSLHGDDCQWSGLDAWKKDALEALNNKGPLKNSLIWNTGACLWLAGKTNNLEEGIKTAQSQIISGKAIQTLEKLIGWQKDQFSQ